MIVPTGLPSDAGACPDYVLVGHVTRDLSPRGFVIGGTVTYAGLTALALGRRVGAVSSGGPDFDPRSDLPGISFRLRPAEATTTFENIYRNGRRQQWIRAIAAPLTADLVPAAWKSAAIAHLAPLAGEFGPEMVEAFEHCQIRGLTPQGWLRGWDSRGFVHRTTWQSPEAALAACDAVVLSEEDVDGDWDILRAYANLSRLLVVTQGVRGCTVFDRARAWQVPAFPTTEVDATGAGDVFAAAFFSRLLADGNPVNAALYANCVASFAVEAIGPSGIPTPAAVAGRLAGRAPVTAVE